MRRLRGWILLLLGLVAAAAAIGFVMLREAPIEVRIAKVEEGTVEETVASTKAGSVRSRQESDVSVDLAGPIVAIQRREGDTVARGDVLLSIDRHDAEAAVVTARQQLRALEAQAAEAAERMAEADRELERVKGLFDAGIVSSSALDRSRSQADALAAARRSAASRAEAQAGALAQAEIALGKCDLRAPIDGIVAERFVDLGEWCSPGKVVMRLFDPERLYVRAELDEVDAGSLRVGLPVRITLDPYRDRRIDGRITRVAPYVSEREEQNRTVPVEAEVTGGAEDLTLLPGTSADLEVILSSKSDVLRIPSQALLEGDRVLVVKDGRARAVKLRIGIRNWMFAEVLDGLEAGDPVIVSLESEDVKDGVRVAITDEPA